LREGQHWEKQILEQIRLRDLFCLFWSEAASKSPWVEKEWKCALSTRGLDYIHPVPLVDPAIVPPPSELGASKHFNDLSRIVIDYETARKGS
jgi:TIR domain